MLGKNMEVKGSVTKFEAFGFRKAPVFGVGVSVLTMDQAVAAIIDAATKRGSLAVSALAVHGLMTAVQDPDMRLAVEQIDIVTPDGQPIRWALNLLHGVGLAERVSGPYLMRHLCARAAAEGIPIYLFGSTEETCAKLAERLQETYPGLIIADIQPDRFREATPEEDEADVRRMNKSGAGLIFVGRGCPRQEIWVAAHRGRVNAAMIAVGAAFDFVAGSITHAPAWMQRAGLEWLWRVSSEPRRLWKRYLTTNTAFLVRLAMVLLRSRNAGTGRS